MGKICLIEQSRPGTKAKAFHKDESQSYRYIHNDRLEALRLTSLEKHRTRTGLLEVFKIFQTFNDYPFNIFQFTHTHIVVLQIEHKKLAQ